MERQMTKQIYEIAAGLTLAESMGDLAPSVVTVVDAGTIEIAMASGSPEPYRAVRWDSGWVWVGKANCPMRAGTEMQRHLSRLARRAA
jgi:hypothetical protein